MAKTERTTVRAHPRVMDPLKRLLTALEAEFGIKATQEEVIGALILGTPAAQVVGMLMAYNRDTVAAHADPLAGE